MRVDRVMGYPTDKVVIVGAGLAGLSAALYLAGAGREVTVCEKHSEPGGKAAAMHTEGYQLDYGPTVLTMPELIEDAFAAVGEKSGDHLELLAVEPAYRAHFPDGGHLDLSADRDRTVAEITAKCGAAEADSFLRYRDHIERIYRYAYPRFVDRNLDGIGSLPPWPLLRLAMLGAFGGLQAGVNRYFEDPRLRRLFSFQAMYVGVAPQKARAMYAMVTYMDTVGGVWLPRGGMHALPRAMAAAAEAHGVRFRYGDPVVRLETTGAGRFRAAITAAGERVAGDAAVLTADPSVALPELLGREPATLGRRLEYAPSCLLLLLGAGGTPGAHHNIHFGRNWKTSFTELTRGDPMSDASFLVSAPTVSDPGLAPPGRHCYYALLPVPNLAVGTVDWKRDGDAFRDRLCRLMRERGYADALDDHDALRVVTPLDWRADGCPAGTPFSAAHLFRQTGPFRTKSLIGGNMVLAGAGTHPGVGVPMALISGRLAAERITGPLRRTGRTR
ncbi:phytoene desaturase family protein [Nocardia sp. NPDC004068]|uniref:phytoene desaturase family protein n=1 Tax=Nocardia sp. NPDC004068 TaxID=3364303 RepID=UPI0036B05BC7